MASKAERITITLKSVRLLAERRYGYGVSDPTSHFYKLTDENDTIYIVGTTHFLYTGDKITAAVVGENEYRGEHQTKLTRVKIIERGPMEEYHAKLNQYIGGLISTDGEY